MPIIFCQPYYTINIGSGGDPTFNNIVFLAHMDGANGAGTYTADETGKTITFGPACSISTAQTKFGVSSLAFDGTASGYATFPMPAFGTDNFTIEFWVRFNTIYTGVNGNMLFDGRPGANGAYPTISYINGTGFTYTVNGSVVISGGSATTTQWHHVAVVRSSGSTKLYVDGTQVGSAYSDSVNYAATTVTLAKNVFVTANLNGYIDEVRVTKGLAQYTTNFTVPSTAFSGRSTPYTASLLHFDGANGATSTTDEAGRDVTLGSAASLSTAQQKFGTASLVSVDNANSYAKIPMPTIGTGNFTLEFFVRFTGIHGLDGGNTFVDARPTVNGNYITLYYHNGNWIFITAGGARITGASTATIGVWYHVALVRSSGSTKLYLNGTQIGSTYADTNNYPASVFTLCHNVFLSNSLIGNIDEFRLRIGEAVYTTNFTPPTSALSIDVPDPYFNDVVFLTNMGGTNGSGTFTDAKGHAITANSVVNSSDQQLFGANTAKFTGTSSSFLSIASTTDFAFGTGNFTIEQWIYPIEYGASIAGPGMFGTTNGAKTNYVFHIGQSSTACRLTSGASGTWTDNVNSGGSPALNQWSHMVIEREGANLRIYRNGILLATASGAAAFNFTGTNGYIGLFNDGTSQRYLNGYVGPTRITKRARYGGTNFTPPTAAFPTN